MAADSRMMEQYKSGLCAGLGVGLDAICELLGYDPSRMSRLQVIQRGDKYYMEAENCRR